jgi:hypothetical protein
MANVLFRGVLGMKESSTYQAIVEEGLLQEARQLLMLVGQEPLEEPDTAAAAAVNAIADVRQLEELEVAVCGKSGGLCAAKGNVVAVGSSITGMSRAKPITCSTSIGRATRRILRRTNSEP